MYLTIISDTKGTILSCPIDKDINIQDTDIIDSLNDVTVNIRRSIKALQTLKDVLK